MPLCYDMDIQVKIYPRHDGEHRAVIELDDEEDICANGTNVNDAAAEAFRVLANRLEDRGAEGRSLP